MDREELIKAIRAHLARTKELPYVWSKRVIGDKTFLWKLENGRKPYRRTAMKILNAIRCRDAAIIRWKAKKRGR